MSQHTDTSRASSHAPFQARVTSVALVTTVAVLLAACGAFMIQQWAVSRQEAKADGAAMNAVVQILVPPPKYHVQQLVPHARVSQTARLAGLIVIERGGDADVTLAHQEGLEILLANCEDAYGFPPYETIRSVLHNTSTADLRGIERGIIEQALADLPATLLRSSKMDWSSRIPALVNGAAAREEWSPRERAVGGEMAVGFGLPSAGD